MKVPFRLRRLEAAQPALALLLPSREPAELLDLLGRLDGRLPQVYPVADGWLVCLDEPVPRAGAGAIRLRQAHEKVYVPVDAELVPALLQDEASGLARDQGLVFLPNGRLLSFEPNQPLKLSGLVDAGPRRRAEWRPLPVVPELAERIETIRLDLPPEDSDTLLAAGGDDIGADSPRPAEAGPVSQALGQAMLGAGKALHRLGKLLGLKGLAKAGANWMGKALSVAPRLSEALLGKQEAALRELLRRFREGKWEDALRHALPLGGPGDRGGIAASGSVLPTHGWLYSLSSLLGGGGGPASLWFGGQDVQLELAGEYRKAAEQAVQRGDFRRAALIYAKLLRDYRAAAQVLLRGGLFHDAAVVFLQKLNDRRGAAQAFEAGGEFDRALELYRQLEDHLAAAALLRRLGEEDAAVAEFQKAAEQHAHAGDHYAAGNVMLEKAQRPDLARGYFTLGWRRRPENNAVACAVRLLHLGADAGETSDLLALADEARDFFEPPGHETAAEQFYNALAALAERRALEPLREELRDRALMELAAKVRQRAAVEVKPGTIVSNLLGRSGHWPAAVVRDAQWAVAAAIQRRGGAASSLPTTQVRLGTGQVTAVGRAPHTGEVFVGFRSGDVAAYRPTSGAVVRIKSGDGLAVTALTAGPEGQALFVLQGHEQAHLSSYSQSLDGGYLLSIAVIDSGHTYYWLPPALLGDSDCWYVVGYDSTFQLRNVYSVTSGELHAPIGSDHVLAALVFSTGSPEPAAPALLLFTRGMVWYQLRISRTVPVAENFLSLPLGWTPGVVEGSTLQAVSPACQLYGNELELAGVDDEGVVHWSRLLISDDGLTPSGACDRQREGGYLAATLVRPGLVAAVSKSRVDWLRAGRSDFMLQGSAEAALPQAVACFASVATSELLVVCRDGTLERLPLPAA